MASLKEIKARIASVQSTLKITSAMKVVASAKLHRVQGTAAALAEYGERLARIAAALPEAPATEPDAAPKGARGAVAVVACSSDGSLCGAFNANAARALDRLVRRLRDEGHDRIEVWSVGEKITLAARRAGYDLRDRLHHAAATGYAEAAALADELAGRTEAGELEKVYLVYNHFHSMGHQAPVEELFLPADFEALRGALTGTDGRDSEGYLTNYLYEPDAARLRSELIPYLLRVQLYKTLLDSATAEHAARIVAMQTASDNARELLDELTLTYNKRRQQAITAELADITQASAE